MAKESTGNRSNNTAPRRAVPWLWLGLGFVFTLIGLFAITWLLGNFLTQPPEKPPAEAPIIVQLTAPPIPTATIPVNPPTPTVAPTATTAATPDRSVAPDEITVGYYATVVGTGGVGVTVRNGPNTSNLPVVVASEGSYLLVMEGPTPGGNYQWWRIRLGDGTEGWVAGDFLSPSAAP